MGEYDKKATRTRPTAGPSQDDRYGAGEIASNLTARIIKHELVGGRLLITIASGTTHGTRADMDGYVKDGVDSMLAEFKIARAREAVSYAFLHGVTEEQLEGKLNVVINPTSRPTAEMTCEVVSRVIGVTASEEGTRITIPRGKLHGVKQGMTGHLRSKEGRGSFTIVEADVLRSIAVVNEPVDFVTSHPELVLHPQPKPARSRERLQRAVQRRANGAAASSADVQATAESGVAGASSRLPFFDTIQRSFGKHDITGVQAQVGGPAADASRALGAQAYATGNKVAFASAPDLHTAAHEAAHTVQQQRGAVGFQGLGAADDEHERQADVVADAVVAGRSAEPLLDQIGRGTESSSAVQRKMKEPTEFDTHRAIALILRDIEQRASATYGVADRVRGLVVAVAASEITTLLREAVSIAALHPPKWMQLREELRSTIVSVHRLHSDLVTAASETRRELQEAMFAFQRIVPIEARRVAGRQQVASQRSPSTDDQIELARQAMASAREHTRRFKNLTSTKDARAEAIAGCEPLPTHLRVASDQARQISDRRTRNVLVDNVEALSEELDWLASYLSMDPTLPWHRVFAATFDAENDLRHSVGVTARSRPYSGAVDPKEAVKAVKNVALGDDQQPVKFETPATAAGGIRVGIARVFERQREAIAAFEGAIKDEDARPELSTLQKILAFAAEVALSYTVGKVGSVVGAAFRKSLDRRAVTRMIGDLSAMPELAKDVSMDEIRALAKSKLAEGGAIARAAIADGAKDAAKEVFKRSVKFAGGALAGHAPKSNQLLSAFIEMQRHAHGVAATNALAEFETQVPALVQAELPVLQALYDALVTDTADEAYEAQYHATMREWQNVKALAAAKPRSPSEKGARDANIKDQQVDGVLEVYARASGDPTRPSLQFQALKLHGAEPAARKHFREMNLRLPDVGLNQRFQIEIITDFLSETVSFGVGPDHGVSVDSFTKESFRLLKIYASKNRITSSNANASRTGEYDHVSDTAALRIARSWVNKLSFISTARLGA